MPYTKTQDRLVRLPWVATGTDWNGDHTGQGVIFLNIPRTRTGDRNPRWRSQVKAGQNATTPMSGSVDDLVSKPGWEQYKTAVTPGGYKYTLRKSGELAAASASTYPIDWLPMSSSTAYNRGLIAYLKHVNQVNQSFQGLTFLGEARETLRMIRNPAQGLRNIMDAYLSNCKMRKKSNPKNWKKNLSSTWLEYAFGMVPLFNDVKAMAETYNRLFELPKFVPVYGFGRDERDVPNRSFSNLITTNFPGNVDYFPKISLSRISRDETIVKFRGYVRRDDHATLCGAAALAGFDPLQFIPTAWELLPWSFLIDYFTNIGDVLETSVVSRSNIAWTNVSTVIKQTSAFYRTVAGKEYQQGSDVEVDGQASTATRSRRSVVRSTPSDLGVPTFQLELPGRAAQFANMTALFAQANSDIHPQKPPRKYR